MNLAIKSMILDVVISVLITIAGGGSFYSFLFLFVILFLPAILFFVSLNIISDYLANSSANSTDRKKKKKKFADQ